MPRVDFWGLRCYNEEKTQEEPLMAENVSARTQLINHRLAHAIAQQAFCTPEENETYRAMLAAGQPLPPDVSFVEVDDFDSEGNYVTMKKFFRANNNGLTDAEIQELLNYKQIKLLTTIKNCVVFFTVLTIIGLVGSLITVLTML